MNRAKPKAQYICGCMGTTHKPVNNCVNCGRIVCQNENKDACLACGQVLIPIMSAEDAILSGADDSTVDAYKLKVCFHCYCLNFNMMVYIFYFVLCFCFCFLS